MKRVFSQPFAAAFLLALALAGAAPGCRADELVELRLYPCEFAGMEPQAVTVEISGFDGEGTLIETYEVSFDDIAATTFADGYATVGYRKHGDVVRARFRVGWFDAAVAGPIAEANAIAVYDELDVPEVGEVLVLGELAADCAELIAEGTDTGSSESTDTLDSSTSDTTDTSSDSSSTTDTQGTSADTLDTSSDSTDTGDPPGPMVGDPCTIGFSFYCQGGPTPEDAGTPLFCDDVSLTLEPTDQFDEVCTDLCLPGSLTSVNACGNIGEDAKCLCEPLAAPNCAGEQLGCVEPNELHLCFEGALVIGNCLNCATTPEGWYTCD